MRNDFNWLLKKADGIVTLKTEFADDGVYYVVQTIEVTADSTNVYATARNIHTAETVGLVFKQPVVVTVESFKEPVIERKVYEIDVGNASKEQINEVITKAVEAATIPNPERVAEVKAVTKKKRVSKKV